MKMEDTDEIKQRLDDLVKYEFGQHRFNRIIFWTFSIEKQ